MLAWSCCAPLASRTYVQQSALNTHNSRVVSLPFLLLLLLHFGCEKSRASLRTSCTCHSLNARVKRVKLFASLSSTVEVRLKNHKMPSGNLGTSILTTCNERSAANEMQLTMQDLNTRTVQVAGVWSGGRRLNLNSCGRKRDKRSALHCVCATHIISLIGLRHQATKDYELTLMFAFVCSDAIAPNARMVVLRTTRIAHIRATVSSQHA